MLNFCPNCSKNRRSPLFPDPRIKGTKYFPRDYVCKKCLVSVFKVINGQPIDKIPQRDWQDTLDYQDAEAVFGETV